MQQQLPCILIVDDTQDNLDILTKLLETHYQVITARNGFEAMERAHQQPRPDLILLDIMMPGQDGYDTCKALKADPLTEGIPVILITAHEQHGDEAKGFELGAVDYLTKPVSAPILWARLKTHLALSNRKVELEAEVSKRTDELRRTRLKIIQRLGRAAEFRDRDTGFHILCMSHYSRLIAEAYGGNSQWVEHIFAAASMHDIGKIGVPDAILQKPGRLTADEWTIMRRHSEFGAEIIGEDEDPLLKIAYNVALTHHERWDGSGYPNGLKEHDIPIEGRIVAIADVFDALTSDRPYKPAWDTDKAIGMIHADKGRHFDPKIVECFDKALPEILHIKEDYVDDA